MTISHKEHDAMYQMLASSNGGPSVGLYKTLLFKWCLAVNTWSYSLTSTGLLFPSLNVVIDVNYNANNSDNERLP